MASVRKAAGESKTLGRNEQGRSPKKVNISCCGTSVSASRSLFFFLETQLQPSTTLLNGLLFHRVPSEVLTTTVRPRLMQVDSARRHSRRMRDGSVVAEYLVRRLDG
ncbi:uncharacterized protein MCYG_06731 [Microsporum canis CBS 113480]|uniref:Uncharacterized protein n=1 Tax=Arthroderma otae (strain ATCC MYA-4605 / CBS 113480) TaxID=554155 RepID=C5FVH8_ARTOC|nr:uncharacterized protein MCYG_06731 [Microsporum canis CBS 113480]EEQ33912.1 predicted protein [Microsporum canis CBS 113480]